MEERPGEGQELDTSAFTLRTVSHFGELSRSDGGERFRVECRLLGCGEVAEVAVDHPERPENETYLCAKHATEAARVGGEIRGAVSPVCGGVERDRSAKQRAVSEARQGAERPARNGGSSGSSRGGIQSNSGPGWSE